jgi:sialic acid synthase SpsE
MIILDFGSGNTCRNSEEYGKKMIDSLAEVDSKRQCVIKWQLFREAGENQSLDVRLFHTYYYHARQLGFRTTASVFDKFSVEYLLEFEIPFIKMANTPIIHERKLMELIPRGVMVLSSYSDPASIPSQVWDYGTTKDRMMACVSKYPATIEEYETKFSPPELTRGISDHTTTLELVRKYRPYYYECHYKLEDSTGLDAGEFARTPDQIKELLKEANL